MLPQTDVRKMDFVHWCHKSQGQRIEWNGTVTAVQFSGPEHFTLADTRKAFPEASKPYLDESAVQLLQSFNKQNNGGNKENKREPLVADVANISDPRINNPVKCRNKSLQHLVLFCDFQGPVFIQRESASTSDVLLLALRTLARWYKGELEWAQAAGCSIRYD
jgi:hypothetical protein